MFTTFAEQVAVSKDSIQQLKENERHIWNTSPSPAKTAADP